MSDEKAVSGNPLDDKKPTPPAEQQKLKDQAGKAEDKAKQQVNMAGDADEATQRLAVENEEKAKGSEARRAKPAAKKAEKDEDAAERGEMSPAQYDDDGWSDLPVQMRGN